MFRHGDTLSRVIDWDAPDGDPIDLFGYEVVCTISVGSVIFNLTEGDGITVDEDNGRITLELSYIDTSGIEQHWGTWRLQVISASGHSSTLVEGMVYVSGVEDYAS